jgi:CDP-diacylglycerol--glycerol-3-phosphate 3-phosphatidyltransferase
MTLLMAPRLHAKAWASRYVSMPVARVLLAMRISPNALTLTGLAVTVAAAYLLATGHLLMGGITMLAGASVDMLDGAVARLGHRVTRFGALLDSVADRLSEAVVFFGLLVYFVGQNHDLGTYLSFGALAASMLVSYLRARGEGMGVVADVGFMGRPERIVVLGVGLLLAYPVHALGVILVLSALTVGQRIVHVAARIKDD